MCQKYNESVVLCQNLIKEIEVSLLFEGKKLSIVMINQDRQIYTENIRCSVGIESWLCFIARVLSYGGIVYLICS